MILITGATGLVGSHLALHLLEKGFAVKAIYRDIKGLENPKNVFEQYAKQSLFSKINWIQADILDVSQLEIAFQDCTHVYHCAALVSFDPNDEDKLRKANIEGTANIVNFCIEKKIKKLCHVSSIATLGHKKDFETHIDESTEWNPDYFNSDYAISKYGAEMEVWRGKQEGLDVVVVNPGVILSQPIANKNWDHGSTKIFNLVRNGLRFYTTGKTGFVAVEDVVEIMYKLMESNSSGERFCLVSENKKYHEILVLIAKAMHKKPPTFEISSWIYRLLTYLDWFFCLITSKKRVFSNQIATSLHDESIYNSSKIISLLSFEFKKINEYVYSLKL